MVDQKPWDRADFADKSAWAEMDAFIKQCEAEGSAKSDGDRARLQRRFLDILERCNARALALFARASSGNAAPHLHLVGTDRKSPSNID